MPWFSGKQRTRAVATGRENAHAWVETAHELEQPRISTAAGLEQLQADPAHAPAKSRWDKATVIIQAVAALAIVIPLIALFVSIDQFNAQQKNNAAATLEQQRSNEKAMLEQQRQATLSGYLDDMSVLVLQYKLQTSGPNNPVRTIAVARTLTAVRVLDGSRKATLIRYLWEAGLITRPRPILNIRGANLTGTIFSHADLHGVALSNVFLNGAQFVKPTSLVNADLSGSFLYESDLTSANLSHADLHGSYPIGANLAGARLTGANLAGADLTGADLTGANLTGADLKGARYNSTPEYVIDPQGKRVLKKPTQWPQRFDPQAEGAICDTCGR